jgi:hypothetical protein
VFEFDAAIPGDPLLEISMMDYDLFGGTYKCSIALSLVKDHLSGQSTCIW